MPLSTADRDRLKNLLGPHVTFERRERRLYGHDIAAMPSLVRPLVGDTTPTRSPSPQAKSSSSSSCVGRAAAACRSRRAAKARRATAAPSR